MSNPEEQQKYIDILGEIAESYALIKTVRPLTSGEAKYFTDEFAISASHNSNAIEGNTFTFDETRLLIEKGIITGAHSLRESEDIIGYKEAFDFLCKAVKNKTPISESFIKQIHSLVLRGDGEAGKYRAIQNYIGSPFKIVYTPCPPEQVGPKMSEYTARLQSELDREAFELGGDASDWMHFFRMLAEHHAAFENIHPFIDGNGRTGRLLLAYEMILCGLLPVDIRYEQRDRYYAALRAYKEKEKYSTRPESKTDGLAKLLAESELESMRLWLKIYGTASKN